MIRDDERDVSDDEREARAARDLCFEMDVPCTAANVSRAKEAIRRARQMDREVGH
jgi:hypothetical protein